MKNTLRFLALIMLFFSCANKKQLEITSPDGLTKILLYNADKDLSYSLDRDGETIISESQISILEGSDVKIEGTKIKEVNETWKTVWGGSLVKLKTIIKSWKFL